MNIMGTAVDVSMTAAQAAKFRLLQQAGAAEKKRRVDKARTAIKRYDWAPNEPRRKAALRAIDSCSLYASSENRLTCVLSLTELAPPEIFWPALMEAWSGCDATWNDRHYLLAAMKNAAIPATAFLSRAQRNFFDALPPRIVIFRRCSRSRVRAVSWTTDQKVAEDFASGHRNIPVPNPVLAAAVISKEHIFFVTDDRNEKEVILNPRRLRKLMIEPYTPRSHT